MKAFWHWLTHNAGSAHHRWMMRYLERRGWVVFYLDDASRQCGNNICWIELYESQRRHV